MSSAPIYMVTVSAPTNIAVIKYWGKADAVWNTPINSSVSVTLDQADLRAVTTVAASTQFASHRLWLNGRETPTNKRFDACLQGLLALTNDETVMHDGTVVTGDDWKNRMKFHVSSYNTFPTAAGLASSAAGYAALVKALATLMQIHDENARLSTIARQGSGSACRSLYGGFVAWRMGNSDDNWSSSKAEQIADETHWPQMRALILVVSDQKKDTSSTAGMSTSVATSALLKYRAESVVPMRMQQMEQAWLHRDFQTFAKLTMQDSNQFHATCLDTYPPIFYMNDISRSIIRLITVYNDWAGEIRAAYTFDAGPNAVLYVLEKDINQVGALMLHYYPAAQIEFSTPDLSASDDLLPPDLLLQCDQTGRVPTPGDVKTIYLTRPGPGPQVLPDSESTLDPVTGENTYQPK